MGKQPADFFWNFTGCTMLNQRLSDAEQPVGLLNIIIIFVSNYSDMKSALKSNPLNRAQIMVLQVVKEQFYDEKDLEELRALLLDFNNRKMQQHLDDTIAQKGYTKRDFEKMIAGHQRKRALRGFG